jgi:hypothetical protein
MGVAGSIPHVAFFASGCDDYSIPVFTASQRVDQRPVAFCIRDICEVGKRLMSCM